MRWNGLSTAVPDAVLDRLFPTRFYRIHPWMRTASPWMRTAPPWIRTASIHGVVPPASMQSPCVACKHAMHGKTRYG